MRQFIRLVPEPVARLDAEELVGDDAGEGGAHESLGDGVLRQPACVEVYVVYHAEESKLESLIKGNTVKFILTRDTRNMSTIRQLINVTQCAI